MSTTTYVFVEKEEKIFLWIPTLSGAITQQLSSALSSDDYQYFRSHCCKQCGPRSDCSSRSSLICVHTVCLYAKSMFEKLQEDAADDINR